MNIPAPDLPALLHGLSRMPTLAGLVSTVPHEPGALALAATATTRASRRRARP